MLWKLVVFGDSPDASDKLLSSFLGPSYLIRQCARNEEVLLDKAQADLLVFWPRITSPTITQTLVALRCQAAGRPTLAIIPGDADAGLVKLASDAADDFILSPVRPAEFLQRVERMLGPQPDDVDDIARRLSQEFQASGLIGEDPRFLETLSRIPLAAQTQTPILIAGETGTGKEVLSRAIHSFSSRRDLAFIPVDCASIPEQLFENELFGHLRGAFTDARNDQKGLIGMANGGTLFLDEIDSLSVGVQAKLLRFLQERTYRPLGSDRFLHADVKLVAATNKDLNLLVESKQFRPDLFFRLNILRLELAPLRDRRKDIPLLARHFLRTLCADNGIAGKTFTSAALRKMEEHPWPGNVRELQNMIQRAVIFCDKAQLGPSDLNQSWTPADSNEARVSFRQARAQAIESFRTTLRRRIVARVRWQRVAVCASGPKRAAGFRPAGQKVSGESQIQVS